MLTREQKCKFEKEIKSKPSLKPADKIQTSFDFWDFGGQFVFYATHTMFHSRKAIYLLVFDLSTQLNQEVIDEDEDFPSEQGSKTMAHYIQFWMNSIHSFVGKDDGNEPVVLLVGTHKDKIHGSEETKNKYIQQYFSNIRELFGNTCLINHIYPQDFAVNNQTSKDQAVDTLRNTVMEIGDNLSSTIEIPAKWIQLEKLLNDMKHLKIIQLDVIKSMDSAMEYPLGSKDQVKLFLQYHHSKGTFVFFDEPPISDYIILDPQFLIDAFKSIITSERLCTKDPEVQPLLKRLRSEGRLEKSLIEYQWGKGDPKFLEYKQILLGFLTKHHIISEATRYDENTNNLTGLGWYIVPSLLQEMSSQSEVMEFLKGRKKTSLRFTMKFNDSAVVSLVYCRLTAALLGRWSDTQLRDKPLVFRNICIIRLNTDYVGVSGLKHECIELFLVKLLISETNSQCEQGDSFRRFAESVIKHEFRKLKAYDERKTMPYTVCFRCNHESHDINGSTNILTKTQLDEQKRVTCPDLVPHDINTETAKSEWYTDIPLPSGKMNYILNDMMLGQLSSQCIGSNWQLLGLELGLTQVQIDHIIEDNPYSTAMKIYTMLKKWTVKLEGTATMEHLVTAMNHCPKVTIDWDEIRNFDEKVDVEIRDISTYNTCPKHK